jgi:transposase
LKTKWQIAKETRLNNKSRRKSLCCKIFELKIDESHLSKSQKEKIGRLFLEAKWLYNGILGSENIFQYPNKLKDVKVNVFNPETQKCDLEEIRLLNLKSQIKQGILKRTKQNIYNLAKAKAKGLKIGGLKFVKKVNSIPLNQYGKTYKINKYEIYIVGVGWMKVRGSDQIKSEYEKANANLIKRASGYFLQVTCFTPQVELSKCGEIGLDFGIKDSITLSDGRKFNWDFKIPKTLKHRQRKASKKKKGSKNRIKANLKVKKLYEKWTNKKNDAANKFVHSLKRYKTVVIQDENLKGWQSGLFGLKIHNGILGRIKDRIKRLSTSKIVGRYEPTTILCPKCLVKNRISLSQRDYSCGCGFYHKDRDVKAAITILTYNRLTERKLLPVEDLTAFYSVFDEINKLNSVKQEASTP